VAAGRERAVVNRHTELAVYRKAFAAAMRVFEITKTFPVEERYALSDQLRRSSRSVCANLAEAWRKRRYEAAFVSKLSDSEAEAAETQTWLQFAAACAYLSPQTARELDAEYDQVIGMLVSMIRRPKNWSI
jgi:four helix bundle protein